MGQVGRQPKKNPKLLKTIENCHLLFRQIETYDADVQTDDIDLKEASCQVGTEALPADSTDFRTCRSDIFARFGEFAKRTEEPTVTPVTVSSTSCQTFELEGVSVNNFVHPVKAG